MQYLFSNICISMQHLFFKIENYVTAICNIGLLRELFIKGKGFLIIIYGIFFK